jgi:hypothetical protein
VLTWPRLRRSTDRQSEAQTCQVKEFDQSMLTTGLLAGVINIEHLII